MYGTNYNRGREWLVRILYNSGRFFVGVNESGKSRLAVARSPALSWFLGPSPICEGLRRVNCRTLSGESERFAICCLSCARRASPPTGGCELDLACEIKLQTFNTKFRVWWTKVCLYELHFLAYLQKTKIV
jgi:hypothetical protein